MSLQKINIKDNINLYYTPTCKFKTTALSFYVHRPLTREECTLNSLLCMVLRRSSPSYPKSQQLSRYLDNLYGVAFSTNVRKKGERQLLCANFQFINDKFLENKADVLTNVLNLAKESLFERTFINEEYLKQEKENLKQQIMSIVNDKRQYTSKKCIEAMCKDEPYGVFSLGYVDDIDSITSSDLLNHYKNVVLNSPIDVFVTGDVDIDFIKDHVFDMVKNLTPSALGALPNPIVSDVKEVKSITEQQQIAQGKLCMGFRTGVFASDDEYPALMMYNSILGCGIFSKLFNNVREKLSLCYYASSSIDHLKGIMTINSGIEVSNFKKAYDEILVQIKDIEEGNISDVEMSAAVLGTINSINSLSDNPFLTDDYYLGKIISGNIITPDELVKKIKSVKKQEVIDVAKKIKLDTVYFLKGREE